VSGSAGLWKPSPLLLWTVRTTLRDAFDNTLAANGLVNTL
jgi:hypothetical protein